MASKSLEERQLFITTRNWEHAARPRDIIKRTISLPGMIDEIEDNWFNDYGKVKERERSYSTSDLDKLIPDFIPSDGSADRNLKQVLEVAGVKQAPGGDVVLNNVNAQCNEEQEIETPMIMGTPKRKLKFSPQTPGGLEGKLRRISLHQTASPTLRKVVGSEVGRERCLTVGSSILVESRKKVLGRRRFSSVSGGGNFPSESCGNSIKTLDTESVEAVNSEYKGIKEVPGIKSSSAGPISGGDGSNNKNLALETKKEKKFNNKSRTGCRKKKGISKVVEEDQPLISMKFKKLEASEEERR